MRKSQHKMCTLLFLILSIVSVCCSMGVMADDAILRIATTNEVKSPAFIGDYTLGLFNHLSAFFTNSLKIS